MQHKFGAGCAKAHGAFLRHLREYYAHMLK